MLHIQGLERASP